MLKPPALNYMGFDYNLHKASFKHAINSYSQKDMLFCWALWFIKSYHDENIILKIMERLLIMYKFLAGIL